MADDRTELTLAELLYQQIDGYAYRIRTHMPAEVISFNEARNTVDVQPLIMQKMKGDDRAKPLPVIKDVPVKFYGAGGYVITFKPAAGDVCELAICDRSLEKWKLKGGVTDPQQRRHHNLADATAYFGLNDYGGAYGGLKNGLDVRSADGSTGVHVEQGQISIRVGGTDIATISASQVEFLVPVIGPNGCRFGNVGVETHKHTPTGPSPIPGT